MNALLSAQPLREAFSPPLPSLDRGFLLQKMQDHKGPFLTDENRSYALTELLKIPPLAPLFAARQDAAALHPLQIAGPISAQIAAILQAWTRTQIPVLFSPHWPAARCQKAWQQMLTCETQPPNIPLPDTANWASILFTSGSTGPAKAIVHTYLNHLSAAASSHLFLPFSPPSSWLLALPLFHIGGLQLIFRALFQGATLVSHEKGFLKALHFHSPSHLSLVDKQLRDLLKDPLACQKAQQSEVILLGGGPLSPATKKAARAAHLPFRATYGSTETCAQCITASAQNPAALTEVLPGRQMHITSTGEIAVKGPQIAAGQLIAKKLHPLQCENGFYISRDRGFFTEKGELQILGRSDLQFISGGENIQPEQIERALLLLPHIQEAVVVPLKDADFGQRPFAFLKMHPPHVLPAISVLKTQLQKHLARHEFPVAIAALPHSSTFKINREALRIHAQNTAKKNKPS